MTMHRHDNQSFLNQVTGDTVSLGSVDNPQTGDLWMYDGAVWVNVEINTTGIAATFNPTYRTLLLAVDLAGTGLNTPSMQVGITSYSGSQVLTENELFIKYTGTGGHTFTLPAANAKGAGAGILMIIKHAGTGSLIVSRAGGDTIDGDTTFTLSAKDSITLISDASSAWSLV